VLRPGCKEGSYEKEIIFTCEFNGSFLYILQFIVIYRPVELLVRQTLRAQIFSNRKGSRWKRFLVQNTSKR
jgi:hypothetical protein